MSLRGFFENVYAVFWIAAILIAVYCFLATITPFLSPVITIFFVLVGTASSVSTSRSTAILSVTGLILYALSWPVTKEFGTIPGMLLWGAGVLIWFFAFIKSFQRSIGV